MQRWFEYKIARGGCARGPSRRLRPLLLDVDSLPQPRHLAVTPRAPEHLVHPLPHLLADALDPPLGVHVRPHSALDALGERGKLALDAQLDLGRLVALVAEPAPRLGGRGRDVQEEDEVGRGEADVGRAAPGWGEAL